MEVLSEFTVWLVVELIYDPMARRFGRVVALCGTITLALSMLFGAVWLTLHFMRL